MPNRVLLALATGPWALYRAGFARRALGWAVIMILLAGLAAYVPYLQIYAAITDGGESAKELTDTAIAASTAWLGAWRSWAPWTAAALILGNVGCALDLSLRR
ncbi:MAG: hypothetical protein JWM80_5515 [Cyanobacteria bacterium RYN_339]|nr:hypothetical protein [Cyanobacteria bacterium RYN_339]